MPHAFFRRRCVRACSSKQGIKTGEKELWDLKKSRRGSEVLECWPSSGPGVEPIKGRQNQDCRRDVRADNSVEVAERLSV